MAARAVHNKSHMTQEKKKTLKRFQVLFLCVTAARLNIHELIKYELITPFCNTVCIFTDKSVDDTMEM